VSRKSGDVAVRRQDKGTREEVAEADRGRSVTAPGNPDNPATRQLGSRTEHVDAAIEGSESHTE
jgi:hypothetical protein